jgi:hypothetical protein
MRGTGALRPFVSKAVRLGSRAALGHPSLALGQTALAVHDKALERTCVHLGRLPPRHCRRSGRAWPGLTYEWQSQDGRSGQRHARHSATDGGRSNTHESVLQMRRGLFFTILALLSLLASVAMAMDNNWSGAALGCVAAGCLFVMASFSPARRASRQLDMRTGWSCGASATLRWSRLAFFKRFRNGATMVSVARRAR